MTIIRRSFLPLLLASALATAGSAQPAVEIPYDLLARRIATALQVSRGERVLLRHDPSTLGPLEPAVRAVLTTQGARVETLPYGPAPDFQAQLDRTDIYIWLPFDSRETSLAQGGPADPAAATPADQQAALVKWLDAGRGRQVHFHWSGGTQDPDGLAGVHSAAFDRIYIDALDIDYEKLSRDQDKVIAKLRSGEVRVTTPAGTDVRFSVGTRPFNKQDGNAAKARTDQAKTRVDREIELPAGVLRVAPVESTVSGVMVIPAARLSGGTSATNITLEFQRGKVVKATAATGQAALEAYLATSPALTSFRELGLGFNPRLVRPAGSAYLPYYGYGDAVVRLSLGDNTELAGEVRGGVSRWLFFPDATITGGGDRVVENGRLTAEYR